MMSLNRREVLKLGVAGAALVAATTLGGCATGPSPTNAESPTPAAAAPVDPTKVPTKEPTGVPTAAATATNPAPEAKATRPVMIDHNVDRLAVGAEGVPSRALTAEQLGQTTEFGEGRTLAALGTGEGSTRLFAGGTSARILDAPKTMTFGGQTYALSGREGNGDLVKYTGLDGKTYVMATGIDSEAYAMSAVLYSVGGDGPMVQPWDGNGRAVAPVSAGWRELRPGEKVVVDQLGNMSIVSADGKVSWAFETLERKWEQAALAQAATAPVPPTSAPTPPPTRPLDAAPKAPVVEKAGLSDSESRIFKPAVVERFEAVMGGVPVKFKVGLMADVVGRSVEPVKGVSEAKDGGVESTLRAWIEYCFQNHKKNGGVAKTADEYWALVAKGEGKIRMPVVNEAVTADPNKRTWESIDPRNVTVIYSDSKLPVRQTQNASAYLGKSADGGIVIVVNTLTATKLAEQNGFGESIEGVKRLKDLSVSVNLLSSLSFPAVSPQMDVFLLDGMKTSTEWFLGEEIVSVRTRAVQEMQKSGPNFSVFQ